MSYDFRNLGYELTVKEIDAKTRYGVLELAGMTGLGIEKVEFLMESGTLPAVNGRVAGEDFLNWVDREKVPVRNQ